METNKGHIAEYESPKLQVVNMPIDLEIENTDCKFIHPRNIQHKKYGQNKRRTLKGKKPTSKYKGVSWHKNNKRWRARICYCQKGYQLGEYNDEKEAALAYDKAAIQLFGEYARTNQMIYPEDFKDFLPKTT